MDRAALDATIALGFAYDGGKTGATVVQLPLGLNLVEPITLKVDNGRRHTGKAIGSELVVHAHLRDLFDFLDRLAI